MKITAKKIKELLCDRLQSEHRICTYNAKEETLRVVNKKSNKGMTVSLNQLVAKAEENLESAISETVYYVTEALEAMETDYALEGSQSRIFPVVRSTSFPLEDQDGKVFVTKEHSAETRVYYALDLGNTYRLIDQDMLKSSGWTSGQLDEMAMQNLKMLSTEVKKDTVAGNDFYFLSTKDGYDAAKILNIEWLDRMQKKMKGEMAVAVPHGDVCIIADVRNQTGYDILAQMCMSFFAGGHIPITALSFLYDKGELEPIFILGKNKTKN
ncbi:DUF1444 family protein [Bacillus testis]|uniref:DUF1444 family protein n=1 Tax=Bacillus testis TaxID=1622072 RepID=UPI00067F3325|nr:DUF1444 family protein [Bacillus testis]